MDPGGRDNYWVRHKRGLSASVQYGRWPFPAIRANAQRNVMAIVKNLKHREKAFRGSNTDSTGSASGNGGRP